MDNIEDKNSRKRGPKAGVSILDHTKKARKWNTNSKILNFLINQLSGNK